MLLGAILISIVVPVSTNISRLESLIISPYVVQATIDAARIIGLPVSKAGKAYAKKIQMPDPILQQITYTPDPVSARRLFFKSYFENNGA